MYQCYKNTIVVIVVVVYVCARPTTDRPYCSDVVKLSCAGLHMFSRRYPPGSLDGLYYYILQFNNISPYLSAPRGPRYPAVIYWPRVCVFFLPRRRRRRLVKKYLCFFPTNLARPSCGKNIHVARPSCIVPLSPA